MITARVSLSRAACASFPPEILPCPGRTLFFSHPPGNIPFLQSVIYNDGLETRPHQAAISSQCSALLRVKEKEINMKKATILMLVLLLTLVFSTASADPSITVRGNGETQVSADTAVVSLGVSARDRDVLMAQQKVNEAIAAIRKALTDQGISEEDINTDYMNIYAMYDYTDSQEQISAYNASSTLAIRVTDLDRTGALIDAAFQAGANTLNGISFSASDTEEARAQALKMAVADARAKAEILAEASGLTITGIEEIIEGDVSSFENMVGNFSAKRVEASEDTAAGTVVQAARLIVSATVTVIFECE